MAFDEKLALRVRRLLAGASGFSEQHMFGEICFLLDGRMSAGVLGDELIVRVTADEYENDRARGRAHTRSCSQEECAARSLAGTFSEGREAPCEQRTCPRAGPA